MAEQEPKKDMQSSEEPSTKKEGVAVQEEVLPETRRSIARLLFGRFIRMDYSDPKKREKI